MHLYWTGMAADLWRRGDQSLEWLLKGAVAGEVFAAGHAETGNDLPLLYSTTKAERVDSGYRFTGRKSFGSLTPVWTYLGLHGMDSSDPQAPTIVHAFMPRNTTGYTIKETWDVLGMRATRSDDTVLESAFVPEQYIARVVATGAAGIDLFVLAIFAWAEPLFGNIYYAIAQRAFDWTVEHVKQKTSLAMSRSMAYHAEVQHAIADMALELEAIGPQLDKIAQDWSDGVDHSHMWGAKLVAAKHRAVEGAWKVVDTALDLAGGFGIFKQSGIERLFRDARLGRLHPANAFLTREFVAKTVLGISIDERPRWG
jgi:alkylation response protein AidB-like acyl-CoA dehydrogenase